MDSYWAIFIIVNCAVWGLVLGLVNWWRYSEVKRKLKKQKKVTEIIDYSLTHLQKSFMEMSNKVDSLKRDHQYCKVGKSIPVREDTDRGDRKEVAKDDPR